MQEGTFGPNDGLAAMPPPMNMGTFGPNDGLAGQTPMDRGIASLPAAY